MSDISERAPCQGDVPWFTSVVAFLSSFLWARSIEAISSLSTQHKVVLESCTSVAIRNPFTE